MFLAWWFKESYKLQFRGKPTSPQTPQFWFVCLFVCFFLPTTHCKTLLGTTKAAALRRLASRAQLPGYVVPRVASVPSDSPAPELALKSLIPSLGGWLSR